MGEGAGEEEGEVEPSHLEESLMGDLRDQKWSPSEKEERSIADCSARGVSGGLRSGEGGRDSRVMLWVAGVQEMAGEGERAEQENLKSRRRAHARGNTWEHEENRSLLFVDCANNGELGSSWMTQGVECRPLPTRPAAWASWDEAGQSRGRKKGRGGRV